MPFLSKVYERLVSSRLCAFMETRHQYAYRKGRGTCNALLVIVCEGQVALDRGKELAVLQIDFGAAFDAFFTNAGVRVGGAVFDVIADFFRGIAQRV